MEAAFETFKKLPDSEQQKFFEIILSITKQNSSENSAEIPETRSPEKANVGNLLESLKKKVSVGNSPDKNCDVPDQRKKQKTLDSWLIKRNDISSCKSSLDKSQLEESSCEINQQANSKSKSNTNSVSENCSDSVQTTVNDTPSCLSNSVSNKNDFPISTIKKSCKSDKARDISVKDVQTSSSNIEVDDIEKEKYNLRSKRKFSKPYAKCVCCNSPSKYFKNGDNFISDGESFFNKLNKHSTDSTGIPVVDCCSFSKDTEINPSQDIFNCTEHFEENGGHNIDDLNASSDNGTLYNLTTKRNDLKLQDSVESNIDSPSAFIACRSSNKCKNVTSRSNNPFHRTNSSSQSSYEAFCTLSMECTRIGINIMDVLQNEKIQNLLSDSEKLLNEAVFFLGSVKSSTGEKLPVVHVLESKKLLLEKLNELQNDQ